MKSLLAFLALTALPLGALAASLPPLIAPDAPFPHILTDAATFSFVAPGISYGDYELRTVDGPIAVRVISLDLRDSSVRVDAALAQDRLVSSGETVSSMAMRTDAVAGVNGDYFDIANTNAPLNVLVQDGRLVHSPMRRYAVAIHRDRSVSFDEFTFGGTLQMASGSTVHLDGVNEWAPPKGGTTILTPAFGSVPPQENVTLVRLAPVFGAPPFATYRVIAIADNTTAQPAGYYVGIGLNAYGSTGVPNDGDTIVATGAVMPGLSDVETAIGGGPLLLKGGRPYDDPDGPRGGEFAVRIPSTGIAATPDGRLLLLEVDGRQPGISIGVTRAQFTALMLALGAREGMALDGGGSSTIVARTLGERSASVQNAPSDGAERKIADGIFAYSDAPSGPPARVAVRPQAVRAVRGSSVELRVAITDEAGHFLRDAGTETVRADRLGNSMIAVKRGQLSTLVPVEVVESPARLEISPRAPNARAGARIALSAKAYDARGFPLALPSRLGWTASAGRIDGAGNYLATDRNADVSLVVGLARTVTTVSIGEHLSTPIELGDAFGFATAPAGGPGSIVRDDPCSRCATLQYDFSGSERAAYLQGNMRLPDNALGLAFDVLGDGNGELLRVAVTNAINERTLLTAVKVDFTGWRKIVVAFPTALAQPLTLKSIYVINGTGGETVHSTGGIALRDVRVRLAGDARRR